MGLYNRLCKRFFAAEIIRLTAQSDSRAHEETYEVLFFFDLSTRFSLSMENEQAGAGRDDRTRFARPNSQARTETGKYSFSLFS